MHRNIFAPQERSYRIVAFPVNINKGGLHYSATFNQVPNNSFILKQGYNILSILVEPHIIQSILWIRMLFNKNLFLHNWIWKLKLSIENWKSV